MTAYDPVNLVKFFLLFIGLINNKQIISQNFPTNPLASSNYQSVVVFICFRNRSSRMSLIFKNHERIRINTYDWSYQTFFETKL